MNLFNNNLKGGIAPEGDKMEFPIRNKVFTVTQKLIEDYNKTDDKWLCIYDAINAQGVHININDVTHTTYGNVGNNRLPNQFDAIEDYVENFMIKELFCKACHMSYSPDDIKQIYCQDCLDADDDFDNLIDEVELD